MSSVNNVKRTGWFDRLIIGLAVVAGATLCALTLLICFDIAARYFRLFAMPWSLEVAEYALLVITFLGTPWVLATGGHVSIDIMVDLLAPGPRHRMRRLSYLIGAVVCAVLTGFSMGAWWRSFSQGTLVVETLTFPEWYFFAVPPPVFFLLTVIFLRWLRYPPKIVKADRPPQGF